MKIFTLLFLLLSNFCFAQERSDAQSLSRMEMSARQQQFSGFTGTTAASDNFDVKYYRCEWELNPAVRFINGKVTVYFKMLAAGSSITLDLMSPLSVTDVKYHGNTITWSQPSNTVVVNFPATVGINVFDSVTIKYQGVPANTGFGSFILDSHAGTPIMWTLSESYGSRDWWPCKNGINDKADSIDVFITHSNQYKAASNGLLQSETPAPNNKIVTHWKHRYPIASYLICMAITNYTVFNNSVMLGTTNLPMQTHCYPESLAAFQANTPKVLEAMQLFHNTFGPYPFIREKYGHVQFGWGGGMEHQTSTFIVNTDESLMAHELGHQWFGDKITCYSWEDIWLNEGFATHLAAYHMETKYPASAVQNRQNVVANITSLPGGSVKVADTNNLNQIFNGRLSYNKGSHLLYMLRFIMSDAIFFRAMRRYQSDPALAYGNATTADLKRNLEQESGLDLTYFFNQWYTGEGYPSFSVKWNVIDTNKVGIQLLQTTSHPSVSFFKLPVALKFKNATQETTVVVNNNFSGEMFYRNVGFRADTVLVDPDYWLITKNNTAQKLADSVTAILTPPPPALPIVPNTGAGIADIFPNPVTDPFTIYLHDFFDASALIRIYNKSGQQVYSSKVTLTNGAVYTKVPVSKWGRGLYIVKISSAGKTIIKQLMR